MQKSAKPLVEDGLLLVNGTDSDVASAIQVGSPRWHTWLVDADNRGFVFKGDVGHFTARREVRRGSLYWYAYRRRGGKLHKTYLGKPEEVTRERLERAGARLAGQATLARLLGSPDSGGITTLETPGAATAVSPKDTFASFLSLTKVTPPGLPQKLVARPRLTKRIAKPVTLICAPSGFGKSTLLNEWQQTCGMPVAWVSLDAGDNVPLRFWLAVVTALQAAKPNLGQELLKNLSGSLPFNISETVSSFTSEVISATNGPGSAGRVGLVLDDYHHIQSPEIHASIQSLLEHCPPNLQVIISSHVKPPLALGRLRANSVVTELEADDLRFTLEEGIDFLVRHTLERPLAYDDMQVLFKRTQGWVAGLTLATLALSKQGDHGQSIASFTGAHTYLREYFMESVLSQQPPPVQAFLLKTSILKHLTGDLCDAVTGQTGGKEMLSRLWRENLFVERLGEQNGYRYHDLFAEMLCSQLQMQCPAEIPRLHRRAAEWYRTQNAPADAVYHLLVIEAWEEAAFLIESIALRELEQFGEDSRLLRWLRQLPEAVVQRHKTLLSVYVRLARVALPQIEVEQFLARAEASIIRKPASEQTSDERDVLVEIQRIRDVWSTGEAVMQPYLAAGEHEDVWQMLNGVMRYSQFSEQELDRAEALAWEVYETARSRHHLFAMLMAGGECAYIAAWRGCLRFSEEIAHQVLQQALDQRGKLPETASIALDALAHVCYERNQLAQAHQLLLRASEVDPNPTSSNMPVTSAVRRALIQSAQGDHAAAQAAIRSALELNAKQPSRLWSDQVLSIHQSLIHLRQGDLAGAERLLNEAAYPHTHPLSNLVRAEILLGQGQGAAAERLLNRFVVQCPHGFRGGSILSAHVMLAVALFQQREVRQARQVMIDAVRRASPEMFIRPFLDHGLCALPVLVLVLRTKNLAAEARAFVKEILRRIGRASGEQTRIPEDELMALSTAASISTREREVLQSLNAGLSNREIAAALSISECTVKTHLTNIYRKLGVNNRMRAVAQAQTLMLV
ncbi:MAG: LuxR C-terminal-related transcriptional regulator [Anaerolineae bacterium]|jgi:LuxR family maltose regulon positive regulatory protein